MKLVEILAANVHAWPTGLQGNDGMTQDKTGEVNTLDSGATPKFYAEDGVWLASSHSFLEGYEPMKRASDYKTAIVTKAQWQVERDKQKGGDWKRHRGGKQPKELGEFPFEVKHRDGSIWPAKEISDSNWRWSHDGSNEDIMAFRIISQPQTEEVEVKKFCMGYKCEATAENIEHSKECLLEAEMSYTGFKIDQIDGPIKWRDTIIHCQAIIEDCDREIERNVQLLDAEGLMMQKDNKKAMQHYAPDVESKDWQIGDILEITKRSDDNSHGFKIGEHVKIDAFDLDDENLPVKCNALDDSDYWYIKFDEARFISSP